MYLGISLSAGGARGFYQLGALHAAECNGLLTNVKYFAGTSIGSIIAMLLAVGWSAVDLFTTLCTDNFIDNFELNWDVNRTIEKFGLFSLEPLKAYIKKLVIHKYGGLPTFKQLHEQSGRVFACTAYRLKSTEPCVYFTYRSHPDMSIVDACILSSNVPFLFESIQYNNEYYVDGGIFDHNPTRFLQSFITQEEGETLSSSRKLLCVAVDIRNKPITATEQDEEENSTGIHSIAEYVKEVMFVSLYCQPKVKSTEFIDAINISSNHPHLMQLKIDRKTKIDWFCSGLTQGLKHFKG